MSEAITRWVEALPLPDPILVMLLAMSPIIELRGSIPVAQGLFGMPSLTAFFWSVLGNMIPVPIILWIFPSFVVWVEGKWNWLHRLLVLLQARTVRRHAARFDRLRGLALILFVAIPLPVTGAWSGSLAAVVFGVDKRKSLLLILIGVLIAGTVVSLFLEALGLAL